MIGNEHLKPDPEIERLVRSGFPIQDPDDLFIDRLHKELMDKYHNILESMQGKDRLNNHPGIMKLKNILPALGWSAVAIILFLTLIWGIKTLVPGAGPAVKVTSTPTPTISPSTQRPPLPTPSIDTAIFYTVEEGDTLSTIEKKTGVPMETIHDLNAFVLQVNEVSQGLQLVIGFEGYIPVFYTVQEGDTVLGICDKEGIPIEYFDALNRLGLYNQGTQSPNNIPNYKLTPGMRVIIGLKSTVNEDNEVYRGNLIVLSEVDLDCDGQLERILGSKAQEIEYFNISPQLFDIWLERTTETGIERVWVQTAQGTGVAYLGYQLFKADDCNQFIVVIGHKGKEGVNVYRWDGERLSSILKLSGRFLFEGNWMEEVFGDYQASQNILYLGELQQPSNASKNTWILRGYQWSNWSLKLVTEKTVKLNGGG